MGPGDYESEDAADEPDADAGDDAAADTDWFAPLLVRVVVQQRCHYSNTVFLRYRK